MDELITPSLLSVAGMEIARVRGFAVAAADFYLAAPWRHLSEIDLIQIESPTAPDGMRFLIVAGAAGSMFGLHFFSNRADYDLILSARKQPGRNADRVGSRAQVAFGPFDELPVADAELWTTHELPVAGPKAYPTALRSPTGRSEFARPSTAELTYFEAVLQVLTTTTEDEIDSGRWCKTVSTCDGAMEIALTIPDLLNPPTAEEWMRRGFSPDLRAQVYMPHYFVRNGSPSFNGQGAAIREINQRMAARWLGDRPGQPDSPNEEAQDLCFEGFVTHGRRRSQLARRALELDPNCVEAHLILAERATIIEDKLEHHLRGLEAAERQLGSAYLTENAGLCWELWPTRSYMRARFGVAECLAAAGRADEAIEHYAELLRLNPKDDQKVRYFLLPLLMAARRDVEAGQLLKPFAEQSAIWSYSKALLAFRLGVPAEAERLLREAIRINSHVLALLCSAERFPRPTRYTRGSFEEACFAVEQLRPAYESTEGALDWLAAARQRREEEQDKRRREQRRKERAQQKKRKRR